MENSDNESDYDNMGCLTVIFIFIVFLAFSTGKAVVNIRIVTDTPIEPKIKVIISDNKVDTLYIYQKD